MLFLTFEHLMHIKIMFRSFECLQSWKLLWFVVCLCVWELLSERTFMFVRCNRSQSTIFLNGLKHQTSERTNDKEWNIDVRKQWTVSGLYVFYFTFRWKNKHFTMATCLTATKKLSYTKPIPTLLTRMSLLNISFELCAKIVRSMKSNFSS